MLTELRESRKQKPFLVRFWSKVRKGEGCWEWTGWKRNGYGSMKVGGILDYTHRISWFVHHGTYPPEGQCVLHECDNPACVRPDHLFLGTKLDNARDAARKGRNAAQRRPWIRRGENGSMARLTEERVLAIRSRYAAGGVTYQQIAEDEGMERSTIGKIITRKLWTHI